MVSIPHPVNGVLQACHFVAKRLPCKGEQEDKDKCGPRQLHLQGCSQTCKFSYAGQPETPRLLQTHK